MERKMKFYLEEETLSIGIAKFPARITKQPVKRVKPKLINTNKKKKKKKSNKKFNIKEKRHEANGFKREKNNNSR